MRDIGETRYVLGIKIVITHPKKLLGMGQEAYIKRVLEHFCMHYSKLFDTPVEKDLTFSLDQFSKTYDKKERMRDFLYAGVVGSLMYIMLCTPPDICFAVSVVSRYLSDLKPTH